MQKEPAVIIGAVMTVLAVLFGLFGIQVTQGEQAALGSGATTITTAVLGILPILQAIWTRSKVFSPASAEKKADKGGGSLAAIVLLVLGSLGCAGCGAQGVTASAVQQAVENGLTDLDEAAQLICVDTYTKQKAIDPGQALQDFCTGADALRPWVELMTRTQERSGRALVR